MAPSMPSEITRSATITSISVKPRDCRAKARPIRSTSRIGNALLVFFLGWRFGLIPDAPFAIVLALLDAQIAVGERCDAPQGGCGIALEMHLERDDVTARQHRELRRPLLALVFLGAVRQSRLEHDLAPFHPEPEAQPFRERALRVQLVVDDRLPLVAPG